MSSGRRGGASTATPTWLVRSANDGFLPGRRLFLGLCDGGVGERFGLLRIFDGLVKFAGCRGGLRGLERVGSRRPLVLERAGSLVGGFGLGQGRLEVVGSGGERGRRRRCEERGSRQPGHGKSAHTIAPSHGLAPGPEIGSPLLI